MSEETNFNECIICQKSDKKLTLVKEPKLVSLNALKNALEERNKCKDVSITGIYQIPKLIFMASRFWWFAVERLEKKLIIFFQ